MIQINLLRVSPDSKYIEFSIECPTNYRFNVLKIRKYDYLTTTGYPTNSDGWVDLSNFYVGTSTKEVIRISTDIFGGSTMFGVEFGVVWIGGANLFDETNQILYDELGIALLDEVIENTPEPVDPCTGKLSDNNEVAYCSDVNSFYEYLLSPMLALNTNCPKLSDDIKKAFVFLFAHTEAMRLGRIPEAEHFYDILKMNFNSCSAPERYTGTYNCNCNG